ncbi:MAG: DUF116 domain-containing protein [Bacteroidota bacterium]|nr:DUF116 domain-containing protein [Bacteroidota bacterium]
MDTYKAVTYSLYGTNNNSEQFYGELHSFSNQILSEAYPLLGDIVDSYMAYVSEKNIEVLRTRDEYLLEALIIGVLWQNYSSNALKSNFISKFLVKRLYEIRSLNPSVKPTVDVIRGVVAYEFLNHNGDIKTGSYSAKTFQNLIDWLNATGEFNEEVLRLKLWLTFYQDKGEATTETYLRKIVEFAPVFSSEGKNALKNFLPNVSHFLTSSLPDYKYKEDYFFAARRENEYVLNMVGAEIMNRAFRESFHKSPNKALLLPMCMRNQPYDGCKAKSDGKELVCKQCFSKCNIGKVATAMKKHNVKTYLIPHSSNFSKFLVKWQDNSDTALIGVACVLNLLTGGYEMKRLGIASQCVFLDYSSCQKHWDSEGEPTSVNISRLLQVVSPVLK